MLAAARPALREAARSITVKAFITDYNHRRYHESIDNLTPADVYFGRGPAILAERKRIKRQTVANRRLQHRLHAA
jgi:putative transposase